MGKMYSNRLLFLSYLLKCPMDDAGNGISEPQNLKSFWGAYPQMVIPPTLERLRTSNFFSLCVAPSKSHTTPLVYTNLENLLFKSFRGPFLK